MKPLDAASRVALPQRVSLHMPHVDKPTQKQLELLQKLEEREQGKQIVINIDIAEECYDHEWVDTFGKYNYRLTSEGRNVLAQHRQLVKR